MLPGFGGVPIKVGEEVRAAAGECVPVIIPTHTRATPQEYHIFRDMEIIAKINE